MKWERIKDWIFISSLASVCLSVALLYPFHFNVYLSRPPSNQTPSCTNNAHQKYIAMPRVFSHTFNFNTQPWLISTHTHSHFLSAAHIHCVLLGRKEFEYHLVVGSEKTQKISQPWWPRDWSQEWVVHLHYKKYIPYVIGCQFFPRHPNRVILDLSLLKGVMG